MKKPKPEIQQVVEPEQNALFEAGESWEEAWGGMPEFVQKDLEPFKTIYVHFEKRADMEAFAKLVEQTINLTTQSIWYPEDEIGHFSDRRYIDPNAPPLPKENEFVKAAEAAIITPKEWTTLLNVGLRRGLEIEEIDKRILEKFGVKPKDLRTEKYESALSYLRDQ
jgi:hypothetical protein